MLNIQQATLVKVLRFDLRREYHEISDIFAMLFDMKLPGPAIGETMEERFADSKRQLGRKLCREAEFTLQLDHYELEPD